MDYLSEDELLDFNLPLNFKTIIKVIGVGGGGSNAVNYMYDKGIKGVDFIVANTDVQALAKSPVKKKIQLGKTLTEGLGAGNKPERGREAAVENLEDIKSILAERTKMVFITAGMGGGTGTGAAPVIAQAAKEMGILTVGIVTIPFRYEGKKRIDSAVKGIREMEDNVDALLIINNEKIREIYGNLAGSKAFGKADEVLLVAAKGIAEIITKKGHINVDFADVETVMKNSGIALMGTGTGTGENRAMDAVNEALTSPLLDNTDIKGAQNILLNIMSGEKEATMDEISDINQFVQTTAGNNADLIWGNHIDENLKDEIVVTIIATGFGTHDIPELYIAEEDKKVTDEVKTEKKIVIIGDNENKEPAKHPDIDTEEETEITIKTLNEDEEISEGKIIIKTKPEDNYAVNYSEDVKNITVTEREEKLQNYILNLEELEDIPAYKRKGINVGNNSENDEVTYSRETLSDQNGEIKIRENNSYLHDKAD